MTPSLTGYPPPEGQQPMDYHHQPHLMQQQYPLPELTGDINLDPMLPEEQNLTNWQIDTDL